MEKCEEKYLESRIAELEYDLPILQKKGDRNRMKDTLSRKNELKTILKMFKTQK